MKSGRWVGSTSLFHREYPAIRWSDFRGIGYRFALSWGGTRTVQVSAVNCSSRWSYPSYSRNE